MENPRILDYLIRPRQHLRRNRQAVLLRLCLLVKEVFIRAFDMLHGETMLDISALRVYPHVYTEAEMRTAKIFRSGNSQAVRIPKDFQLEGDEVEILKKGASLVLRPKRKSWAALIESLGKFTDDFMESGRKQPRAQRRERAF